MKTVAVRNIKRTDAGLASRLGAAGASTVHEAQGRTGLLDPTSVSYTHLTLPTNREV